MRKEILSVLAALLALGGSLQARTSNAGDALEIGLVAAASGTLDQDQGDSRAGFLANFGTKAVGSLTRAQLQYQNVGAGPISDIELGPITGPGAAAFSIFNDTCTGQTLPPQATCIITVDFSPPDAAVYSAAFDVISTSVNSPETVNLLGEGIFDEVFSDRFEGSSNG